MYTAANIEAAIQKSLISCQEQQEAIDFLGRWSQNSESILSAIELFQITQNFNVRMVCSSLLIHAIPSFWGKIDDKNLKNNIRTQLVNIVLNYNHDNARDIIHKYLAISISHIGLFDWPEEWPEFSNVFFPAENSSELQIVNSIKILKYFVKDIQTSKNITELRRTKLINLFLDQTPTIMNLITQSLEQPVLAHDALSIYSCFLLWAPIEQVVSLPLFQKIVCEFLANDETCILCLKCLTSIFISRSDSAIAFRIYSPLLAKSLSTLKFPNQLPVSSNTEVTEFIIRFLHLYTSVFELVFIRDQAGSDPYVSALIDDSVLGLIDTMVSNGISPKEIRNDLIHLYQVVLSMNIDNIKESFWQLWIDILRRIRFEKSNTKIKPSTNFFQPIYDNILSSLFNSLPSAISDDGVCLYQAKGCFNSMFYIDPDGFIEFIKTQSPSPQLCFAIGVIDVVLETNHNIGTLSQIAFELLEHFSSLSNDPKYVVALLYGLSHAAFFFIDNMSLFSRFIELIITCMTENDENISASATYALEYLVTKKSHLFKQNTNQLTEQLVELSEKYLHNLNQASALRMFNVCATLICQNYHYNPRLRITEFIPNASVEQINPQVTDLNSDSSNVTLNCNQNDIQLDDQQNEGNQMNKLIESNIYGTSQFQKLLEPVITVLTNFTNYPNELIETSFLVIKECCNSSTSAIFLFHNLIWPVLTRISTIVIPNTAFTNDFILYVLNAVANMQISMNDTELEQQIREILSLMIQRNQIEECFFDYFTLLMINQISFNMETLYPIIFEKLVLPALNLEDPPFTAIFRMIGQFDPSVIDINWITTISINSIKDLRKEVCESVLNALQNIIYKLNSMTLLQFTTCAGKQIVRALIESITDTMHKPSFLKNVDFLRVFLQLCTPELQEELKTEILQVLNECSAEPSQGFYVNFINYIFTVMWQFSFFKEAFLNLLIILKKASPGDGAMFAVEPVHQNIKINIAIGADM
ncbi:hypothetical protein TRFO_26477 [Tritrichomonas foetus]|uniref:Exportin-1/Importin-beta-like domain-containing protein n=1 Tax=Tritrichomonas foetus TaxID=1144522 RepID=A0A1J4K2X2_9EUKA|nr:hypothetical protein TRFO_26477 [Tritrichomonas foetus]|eukprot:OHT05735.1 hypothetical protein TRFO_26477 [Tritrichomonas foetus]